MHPLKRLHHDARVRWWKTLALGFDTGLSIHRLAEVLGKDRDERLVQLAGVVFKRLQEGQSLSQALEDLPDHFSKFQVSMIRAGEAGGVLPVILRVLEEEETAFVESTRKLWQSMIGPLITLFIASAALFILLPLFVFGNYLALMQDLHLPDDGSPLLAFMRFTQSGWWWGGLAALLLLTTWVMTLRKQREKFFRSLFLAGSRLPQLGRYFEAFRDADSTSSYLVAFLENALLSGRLSNSVGRAWRCHTGARFAATLGRLWQVNAGLIKSVELAIDVSGSALLALKRKAILGRLKAGESLASALASCHVFPENDLLVSMIAVGEESGKVPELCLLVTRYYRLDLETRLQAAAAALSPLVYLLLGGLVGGLVIMMLAPMSKLIESL